MSFMLKIENAQPPALEVLALDYLRLRSGTPSTEFCRRAAGIAACERAIAKRLGVAVSTVRHWREIGERATSCDHRVAGVTPLG